MIELLGEADNKTGYNTITYNDYLKVITPPIALPESSKDKVAIVVAKGTILDGNQKPGTIGGDSTAALLRNARMDDKVKAVVLQVDSGGGSVFGSEVIHIIASPSTITGSIGIFGMITTFENSLEYVGVRTDGVGTTDFAGMTPTRALSPGMKQVIQMNIERGYERFINLVARERNMTPEAVDEIAQGRVWIGTQALELGLVDELGTLEDAVASAATLAELEDYDTKYIVRELSEKELMWIKFLATGTSMLSGLNIEPKQSAMQDILSQVDADLSKFTQLNDPMASYALCMDCKID
jgi:protease-4